MNTAISTVHPWHSLSHSRVARVWPGLLSLSLSQRIARDLLSLPSFRPVFLLKKKKKRRDYFLTARYVLFITFLSIFFPFFFFLSVLLKYFPSNFFFFLIFIYDYFIDCIVILTVPILKVQIKGFCLSFIRVVVVLAFQIFFLSFFSFFFFSLMDPCILVV